MKNIISARVECQKTTIRRAQIERLFLNKRELLTGINNYQAIKDLMPHLRNLKDFMVGEDNVCQLLQSLHRIRQILHMHEGLSFLLKTVELPNTSLIQMKFGRNHQEMTWVDLLVYLFKNYHEELPISEQCSDILNMIAGQFKLQLGHTVISSRKGRIERQFKRLFNNYPYQVVLLDRVEVIEKSLDFIREVSSTPFDGAASYFFVSSPHPNLLQILCTLIERQVLLQVISIREKLVLTIITVIYFIQKYGFVKHNKLGVSFLTQKIRAITLFGIYNAQSEEEFQQHCLILDALVNSRLTSLSQREFEDLQSLIGKEIENQHQYFFKFLKKSMKDSLLTLKPEYLKQILNSLFDNENTSGDEQTLTLKCTLVSVLNYHVINCGNRFRNEDAQMFIYSLGEYSMADRLISLLEELSRGLEGERALESMLGLVLKLWGGTQYEQALTVMDILEQEHYKIMEFQQFNTKQEYSEMQLST